MSLSKHYSPTQGYSHLIEPGESGINNLHFGILNLSSNSTYFDHSADCEVLLIAFGGQCTLLVGHNGNKANGVLGKRKDVFSGAPGVAYIPHHTTYEVITTSNRVEIAICKTVSYADIAAIILDSGNMETELEYQLRFTENNTPTKLDGEAICFFRFQDANGTVLYQTVDGEKKKTRTVLSNNDLLLLSEKTRAQLIYSEGKSYQLLINRGPPSGIVTM